MEIVSKELYEAVYGKTLEELNLDLDDLKYVNINGFYFKCKEWALNIILDIDIQSRGCVISSWTTHNSGKARILVIDKSFTADTEIEAVIKACEYILQHSKKGI